MVVDADAVLSHAVATQRFQAVTRRDSQFGEFVDCVEHIQLQQRLALELLAHALDVYVVEDLLCDFVSEPPDHTETITLSVSNGKR